MKLRRGIMMMMEELAVDRQLYDHLEYTPERHHFVIMDLIEEMKKPYTLSYIKWSMQNKSPPNHPVIHTPATCFSLSHLTSSSSSLHTGQLSHYTYLYNNYFFHFFYFDCRFVASDSSRSFSTCAFGSTFARLHSTTADLRARHT